MLAVVKEVKNDFKKLRFPHRYGVVVVTAKGNKVISYDILDSRNNKPFENKYDEKIVARGLLRAFKKLGLKV